jgi:hypothetical protein
VSRAQLLAEERANGLLARCAAETILCPLRCRVDATIAAALLRRAAN